MSKPTRSAKPPINFRSVRQADVPHSRNGKHKGIVEKILSDVAQLDSGNAVRIPLEQLTDTKANVRSALNRASRKQGIDLKTASDEKFLYVWAAAS